MHYDVIVIGGGPGGYTAAIFAAKKKLKVALVEKDVLGGTCLNYGCIPTKALIHTAESYNSFKGGNNFGISAKEVEIDWPKALKNKNNIIKRLTKGVGYLLKNNQVDVFSGTANLIDKNTVNIIDEETTKEITADNIIIATGSEPILIPIVGHNLEGVITSKEALELDEIPQSMAIIGGGVIGVEMAFIYNSLGSKVTIIEMLPQLLGRQDQEIASSFKERFAKQGLSSYVDSKVISIEKADDGLRVSFETKDGSLDVNVEKVLMAVGRKANNDITQTLELETDKAGILVNEFLQTNIPNIYAVGDVTGKYMLAHVASHQGIIAVKNILGEKTKMDYKIIPSCIYTSPEVASVGLTEEEAKNLYGDEINIGVATLHANGKALTIGKNVGFVKVICEKTQNKIIGVHIIGPQATELISEAVLSIKKECTAIDLIETIHAHPTLSEAVMEAAAKTLGLAILS